MGCSILLTWVLASNPFLPKAIEQLHDLEEKQALQTLEQARHWPQNTPQDLAQVYLYTALAHGALAHEEEAIRCFKNALELDAQVKLPPDASPRLVEWWKRAGGVEEHPPPVLVPEAKPVGLLAAPPPPPPRSRVWPVAGGVATGAGFLGVVVGTVLAVSANSQYQTAQLSSETPADTSHREALYAGAVREAQTGNAVIAVGVPVMVAGAAVLIWSLHGS